jgi:hypothetical protein
LDRKEVARGLALNAMNLFTLYIYFKQHAKARRVALEALKYHPQKKSPLKRAIGTFLPNWVILRYFWHLHDEEWKSIDIKTLNEGLKANPPLNWRP